MGNHFHLVVNMQLEQLAMLMKRLNGGYARYFNARHGRTGSLFEGRFGSGRLHLTPAARGSALRSWQPNRTQAF